jgi:flagellar hook-basal body complex protein FliE
MSDLSVKNISPSSLHSLIPKSEPAAAQGKSFVQSLKESVGRVEDLQVKADRSIEDLATGRRKTLHETMIQVEEAQIAFNMLMAVRRKLVDAYQEIMRMRF